MAWQYRTASRCKNKKHIHINTCLKTFHFLVMASKIFGPENEMKPYCNSREAK